MSQQWIDPLTTPEYSLLIVSENISELAAARPSIFFLGFVSVNFHIIILFWSSPAASTLHLFGQNLAQVKFAPEPTK